ncbi:MAG: sugar ABC transporter permease, partial [Bacilli bacterium]
MGLENFGSLFFPTTSDLKNLPQAMLMTLGWTIIWAIVATFSNYILGIIVALMINKEGIKFKKLWRGIFVMSIAIPQFISLLSIGVLLQDNGAFSNWISDTFNFNLGFAKDTTNGALVTKIIIIIVNIWVGIPYTILSTTGILMNIPRD